MPLTSPAIPRTAPSPASPRAYLWTHPPRTAAGDAMREDPSLCALIPTSQVGINYYVPPTAGDVFKAQSFTCPPATPLSDQADIDALGEAMGREMAHSLWYYGQHRGFGGERAGNSDGLIFPFAFGNVSRKPSEPILDVAPIIGHPEDAIGTGTYALPNQKKAAEMGPPTFDSLQPRGDFSVYNAAAVDTLYRLYLAAFTACKDHCDAYEPPDGTPGVTWQLCYPAGLALDCEIYLDTRLLHQVRYNAGWERVSDLREVFAAANPGGVGTARASTDEIIKGTAGGFTLDDWWQNDVVDRGVWPDTKVLPVDELFNVSGASIEGLGRECEVLSYAVSERAMEMSIVRAFSEVFGYAPRWGNYSHGYPVDPEAPAATLTATGSVCRRPSVTFSIVRAWIDDPKQYDDPTKVSVADRVAAILDKVGRYDPAYPMVAEIPVPRDGDSTVAGVGDQDECFEQLKAFYSAGVYEFTVWNNATPEGRNKDVTLFHEPWTRFLAWIELQSYLPPTGGRRAVLRAYGRDEGDEFPAAFVAAPEPAPDEMVHIDEGLVAGLVLERLGGLLEDPPTGEPGEKLLLQGQKIPRGLRRYARVVGVNLRSLPRMMLGGEPDSAEATVLVAAVVEDSTQTDRDVLSLSSLSSRVRRALDCCHLRDADTSHDLHLYHRETSQQPSPDENPALRVAVLRFSGLCVRTAGQSVEDHP